MNMEPLRKSRWAIICVRCGCAAGGIVARSSANCNYTYHARFRLPRSARASGSTLLIPYFEVDLGNPTEGNTIFTVDKGGRLDSITVNGDLPA